MNELVINSTEDSPEVEFDLTKNNFTISGESRPENAGTFYKPIINAIIKLDLSLHNKIDRGDTSNFVFVFKYTYFNSTSAKYIADIFKNIKILVEKGHNIEIQWHYDKRDEDMLNSGTEFSEMFDLKFHFFDY
ncbi:MAG: DUF1987 domain-containing protein [Bacteroidota bacterium]|nr:DUF1987 domain-containing protein [Bacteroidota bacterium]